MGDRRRAAGAAGALIVAGAVGALLAAACPAAAKGDFPVALLPAGGSLWIAHSDGVVERRDITGTPARDVRTRVGIGARDLALAAERVWALTTTTHLGRTTWLRPVGGQGDPRAIRLRAGPYCHLAEVPGGLVAAACSGGAFVHVDPVARTVIPSRAPAGRITDAAWAGERLWLAQRRPRAGGRDRGTVVVPVDPLTGAVRGPAIPVGRHGAILAAAGDRLWAASGDGRLTAIDATTAGVEYRALIGRRPAGIGATGREVWIAVSRLGARGALIAIAGGRRRVVELGRSGNPMRVAVAGGTVWTVGYRFARSGLQPRLWRVDAARARLIGALVPGTVSLPPTP